MTANTQTLYPLETGVMLRFRPDTPGDILEAVKRELVVRLFALRERHQAVVNVAPRTVVRRNGLDDEYHLIAWWDAAMASPDAVEAAHADSQRTVATEPLPEALRRYQLRSEEAV